MSNMLREFRQKMVETPHFAGPAIHDVRSKTLTFSTYKWVIVITLIVAFYYTFMASDRYKTAAQVYVKSADGLTRSSPQLSLIPGVSANTRDAYLIQAYVDSRDMFDYLEKNIQLSEHYSSDEWDFYARLADDAPVEDRFEFYRKMTTTSIEAETGIVTIKGQAFSEEFSLKLTQAILEEVERYINGVGHNIALQEIEFVEKEMKGAYERMEEARTAFIQFQNANGILSVDAAGQALLKTIAELQGQLAQQKTEEKVLLSFMTPESPELVTARAKIAALEEQITSEQAKLANKDSVSLNDQAADYKRLEMNLTFTTKLYQTALVSLEKARIESYRKLKYMVVVQTPKIPEQAVLPLRLNNVITVFVVLSLLYGVIAMIIATIREHRDV